MSDHSAAASNADSSSSSDPLSLSILQPLAYSASTCGYCAEEKGKRSKTKCSKSYGCWAHALSCATYKKLLDQGWRRSGCYLYKPDMGRTCCPQYTISLDSNKFQPSRSQRQLLQRFSTFMREGGREGEKGWGPASAGAGADGKPGEGEKADVEMKDGKGKEKGKTRGKGKGKAQNQGPLNLGDQVHGGDWERSPKDEPFKHKFEYILEPASFSQEKYALFKRYQMEVHGEAETKVSAKGFRRFLCDTPLDLEPTSSPTHSYGSHHALYRLDGVLIAFAVLDLLPGAVSSVYFVWDPEWAGMSLGKVSALREIQMVREMEDKGLWERGTGRYMMGFYIHSCAKMRYKADYQPSFLLDPATNTYFPWSHVKPLLDAASPRVASFSQPDPSTPTASSSRPLEPLEAATNGGTTPTGSEGETAAGGEEEEDDDEEDEEDDDDVWPSPPPLGCLDPQNLSKELLLNSFVLEGRTLAPLLLSTAWHDPHTQQEVRELLAATGEACAGGLAIWMGR
ncbi:hypothetical protein JCM5296_006301 [Sporobolomyces johnsonii]